MIFKSLKTFGIYWGKCLSGSCSKAEFQEFCGSVKSLRAVMMLAHHSGNNCRLNGTTDVSEH